MTPGRRGEWGMAAWVGLCAAGSAVGALCGEWTGFWLTLTVPNTVMTTLHVSELVRGE